MGRNLIQDVRCVPIVTIFVRIYPLSNISLKTAVKPFIENCSQKVHWKTAIKLQSNISLKNCSQTFHWKITVKHCIVKVQSNISLKNCRQTFHWKMVVNHFMEKLQSNISLKNCSQIFYWKLQPNISLKAAVKHFIENCSQTFHWKLLLYCWKCQTKTRPRHRHSLRNLNWKSIHDRTYFKQ